MTTRAVAGPVTVPPRVDWPEPAPQSEAGALLTDKEEEEDEEALPPVE